MSTPGTSAPRLMLFAAFALAAAVLLAGALQVLPANGVWPAALGVLAAIALVLAGGLYLLSPLVSAPERARARAAYGSHRDILANGVTAVAIGQLVFLPLLVAVLAAALHWQQGPSAIWQGAFTLVREQQSMVLFLALVALDLALLLVVYLRVVRTGATGGRDLGLAGGNFWKNVRLGFLGWLAMLVLVVALRLPFASITEIKPQEEIGVITAATPGVFSLFFVAGALLAPFTEELFFRGYVFKAYLLRKGTRMAYLLSAVAFALPHTQPFGANPLEFVLQNLPLWVPVMGMGALLAYLFHRSGSLVAPVVAHGLNNAIALLASYLLASLGIGNGSA